MENIASMLGHLKSAYDAGESPLEEIGELSAVCLAKLSENVQFKLLPARSTTGKNYGFYSDGKFHSRPVLPELMIKDSRSFKEHWSSLLSAINSEQRKIQKEPLEINTALHTAISAFSACYDLWKPRSRKTPGTFYEIIIGSTLGRLLRDWPRTKYIPIPNEIESVSTDIVFESPDKRNSLVFPVKTTTRERIVQPFAHQRILESVFGPDRYKSLLICVSELQRVEDQAANEICVPGTIRLFQKHLSTLTGIYYLDPPNRYLAADVTSVLKVGTVGNLLAADLSNLTV